MLESWSDFVLYLPEFGLKLLVAFVCGLLLGFERERRDKPAGLRTIVLITVGSTLYMIVSELIPLITEGPESITRADPGRIASQVVSGIGFLGAGTIIQSRGTVHGLTTAAVIWVAAGIGLCVGVGFPLLGLGITLFVVLMLWSMTPVRRWLSRRGATESITVIAPDDMLVFKRIREVLASTEVRDDEIELSPHPDGVRVDARVHVSGDAAKRLYETLSRIEGVHGLPVF